MLYILEYRRRSPQEPFAFAGLLTVQDGKILYRYKSEYEAEAIREIADLEPTVEAIMESSDDRFVLRRSVIYSEDDIDTLFRDLLEAEQRRRVAPKIGRLH